MDDLILITIDGLFFQWSPAGRARGTSIKTTLLRPWALKRFGAQAPRLRRVILSAFMRGHRPWSSAWADKHNEGISRRFVTQWNSNISTPEPDKDDILLCPLALVQDVSIHSFCSVHLFLEAVHFLRQFSYRFSLYLNNFG